MIGMFIEFSLHFLVNKNKKNLKFLLKTLFTMKMSNIRILMARTVRKICKDHFRVMFSLRSSNDCNNFNVKYALLINILICIIQI